MEKGFNFVHERQRVRLRVYRRVFFPKYVNIEGKTEKIFVDTGGQKRLTMKTLKIIILITPLSRWRSTGWHRHPRLHSAP